MIQEHTLNEKYTKMGFTADESRDKSSILSRCSPEDREFFERIKRDRYTVQIKGRI